LRFAPPPAIPDAPEDSVLHRTPCIIERPARAGVVRPLGHAGGNRPAFGARTIERVSQPSRWTLDRCRTAGPVNYAPLGGVCLMRGDGILSGR